MKLLALLLAALAVPGLTGCKGSRAHIAEAEALGGNVHHGRSLIKTYGCGVCHMIPGVHGADGVVGPPLNAWAERSYIGGELPNVPNNLVRWIVDPPAIEPNTAMPDLGMTPAEAKDVAAYLYTLN